MAALVLAVLPVAVLVRIAGDEPEFTAVAAIVWLEFQVILGVSGAMFFARWRVTGEASIGWLSAGMVMMAIRGTPFATADLTDLDHRSGSTGDLVSVLLAVPVVVVLALAAHGARIPDRLHPLVLGVALGVVLLGIRLLYPLVVADPLVHFPQPEAALAAVLLSSAYVVALALHRRRRDVPPASDQFVAVVASLLTVLLLSPVGSTSGHLWSWTATAIMFVLSVWVLMAAVSVLLESLSAQAGRLMESRSTPTEPSGSNGERRGQEELFHELRSTVADISSASQLLLRNDDRLSASNRERLEAGLATEVARLQRLVSKPEATGATTVPLDQVIAPLVVCQRAVGHDIRWEPSGHHARGRADDISEMVHILIHNSLRHAPGSTISVSVRPTAYDVEIRVSDGGPGIPVAMRDSLFQRGTRGAGSPGSGLGLYLARRLADQQGGNLQLRHNDGIRGASFVITLPRPEGMNT